MTAFILHSVDTAPEESRAILESFQNKYGFLPNIIRMMAGSPSTLKAYMGLSSEIAQGTLSPLEQHIVQITTNKLNGCRYCIATHSKIADESGLDMATLRDVIADQPLKIAKLEALHHFTKVLITKGGRASDSDVDAFVHAGYAREQAMEVVASIARKMLSNYIALLVSPPVDEVLNPYVVDVG